jgi:hypothetical protein
MQAFKKFVLYPLAGLFGLLLLAAVGLFVYLSGDRLRSLVEPALESALQREATIEAVRLRLFRTFPRIGVGVEGLTVHTPNGPDLASIDELWILVPLSGLFGEDVVVERIEIVRPSLLVQPLAGGGTTLDGLGGDEPSAPPDADSSGSAGTFRLDRLTVRDGALAYADTAGTLFTVADLDADLRAALGDSAILSGFLEAYDLTYESAGIPYIEHWDLRLDLDAAAHLDTEVLRLHQTRLRAENLDVTLAGVVSSWSSDPLTVDLSFNSPNGTIEGFLSLLPATLTKDFDGLTARGTFSLSAAIAGQYGTNATPRVDARLTLSDGSIQYPDLPEPITGIALDLHLAGDTLDVARINAEAAGNRFAASGRVVGEAVDVRLSARTDLGTIPRFYPLDPGTSLAGMADAELHLVGSAADPTAFQGSGEVVLNGVRYASADLPQPVEALDGTIRLDRDAIRLDPIVVKAGRTDATLTGVLTHYMSFLAEAPDAPLPAFEGRLVSRFIHADELIPEDTTDTEPLDLPNLRIDLVCEADSLVYAGVPFTDGRAYVRLADDVLTVDEIQASMFGGTIGGEIAFSTQRILEPTAEGVFRLESLDANRFFQAMETVNRYAKVGGYFEGLFDSEARFSVQMDSLLNPRLQTARASGLFGARDGSLADLPILQKLSSFTGLRDLSALTLNDWSHAFSVVGEQLQIQDLTLRAGTYSATLNGVQGVDGSLDYALSLVLPASASETLLNAPVGAALKPIAGVANATLVDPATGRIVLDLLARGSFSDPGVSLNTSMMKSRLEAQASSLLAGAREEAQARLDSLAQAQKEALEREAAERLGQLSGGALDDSTRTPSTGIDSLKAQGQELVKDRLKGLLNRRRPNN